jgi:hypothetical protein
MKYISTPEIGLEQAKAIIFGSPMQQDTDAKTEALIRLSVHAHDWCQVQDLCLQLLESEVADIRQAAVCAIGNIPRVHKQIDLARVLEAFKRVSTKHPELDPHIEDSLDWLGRFLGDFSIRRNW